MTEVRVVNSSGDPTVCYRCDKPATAFINTSITMASSVPSHMEPVCAEHDPYKTRDITLVPQAEWDRLQAQLAVQAEVIRVAKEHIDYRDLAFELRRALVRLEVSAVDGAAPGPPAKD